MAAATHPNLKAEYLSSVVLRELEFQAKLLPTITDVSMFAQAGYSSIKFPKLSSFSVQDRAFGAASTEAVLTDSSEVLLLDKNKIVHWIIDAKDNMQTSIEAEAEYAKRAASAHGRAIDTEIAGVIETAGRVDWGDGVSTGDITRDNVLDMLEGYQDAEGAEGEAVFVVSNDQHKALLKIAEFTENQVYGPNDAIRAGQIGTLYGVPVIRRSGLAAQTFYLYGKEAVALGFQAAPQMDSMKAVRYGSQAMEHVMDVLYGLKALRINEKGAGASQSALIFKDRN